MTPYARRDQALLLGFGVLLVAFLGGCAWQARSRRQRVTVVLIGLATVGLTFLATVVALIAP